MAIDLFNEVSKKHKYIDYKYYKTEQEYFEALSKSSTIYVGNLTFTVDTHSIATLCERIGPVRRVIMGINRHTSTPCGFCFVEYVRRSDALAAVSALSGTTLCGNAVQIDLDPGFQDGRQYGRGAAGNQQKDDKLGDSANKNFVRRQSYPSKQF